MIIYGVRAVDIKSKNLRNDTCHNCDTLGSLILNIYRKHTHIFWIPFFPLSKKGFSQCRNCKQVLEPKEMTDPLKRALDNFKHETKGPIWQFSGLALLAFIIIRGFYMANAQDQNEKEYLASPQIEDVYHNKVENGNYSSLKVVQVSTDSVFVLRNEYAIDRMSKISKINKKENYLTEPFGIARTQLDEMYNSNEIFYIER